MTKQILLTEEGLRKYETELEHLKTVRRKEIAEKIKVALSFGDLSENSEYDEAKNDQAKMEARIAEIEAMLIHAKRIDEEDVSTEVVHVGCRVKLLHVKSKQEIEYQMVGSTEADPRQGRISDESPLGKALLGCKKGTKVQIEAPAGMIAYKILEISK